MDIEQFRATGRDVPDLAKYSCTDDHIPGRVYLDNAYIERVDHKKGKWQLVLANDSWLTNDLCDLEVRLYDWCLSEGAIESYEERQAEKGGPEDISARLCDLLKLFCDRYQLQHWSADELANSLRGDPLSKETVDWLDAYSRLWEASDALGLL